MNILDSMKDIVKHTSSLGFIDMVKIVGTDDDAKIEAMDADKTVVVYGSMLQPITGLEKTVGLSRMGVLKGFLDIPQFAEEKAKVEEQKQDFSENMKKISDDGLFDDL